MSEDAQKPDARVGTVLASRYRLLQVLGTGGMGSVYEAEHVVLKRPRAVKILHADLAVSAGMALRFEREAVASGRLRHPNCVEVSDFGKLDDGTLYLAMDLVKGRTLRAVLEEETALSLGRAMHVLRQVLSALAHAHGLGIVHRDIKPENIILCERGGDPDFVKLLDFGIAKLLDGEEGGDKLTQTGFAIGTPRYLAPEQALGVPLDGRVDLYAATIVFFELVAGRTPFEGEGVQLVTQHLTAEPPKLSDIAKPSQAVPPLLDQLVAQMLSKVPDDRLASADDTIAALDAVMASAPQAVRAPSLDGTMGVEAGNASVRPASELPHEATVAIAPAAASSPAARAQSVPPAAAFDHTALSASRQSGAVGGAAQRSGAKRFLTKIGIGIALLIALGVTCEVTGPSRDERIREAVELLQRGETCEQRREAIRTLRQLRAKEAIPALKRARHRMRGGVIGIGDRNTNTCLKTDAEEAIRHLGG